MVKESLCVCDHPIDKHLLIWVGKNKETRERDKCTLCPCRVFRQGI